MRKLGLSHNLLGTEAFRTLLREGGASLELLRVSCNPIESLPDELWGECCPRLAWFGFAGGRATGYPGTRISLRTALAPLPGRRGRGRE